MSNYPASSEGGNGYGEMNYVLKTDDINTVEVSNGDGYGETHTAEATSDTKNGAGTDQLQYQGSELYAAGYNAPSTSAIAPDTGAEGQDDAAYYDPAQYQNYYYQDEDGNCYYYNTSDSAQQQQQDQLLLADGGAAGATSNLTRAYEYDAWEPRHFNWFADIVVDIFMCTPFKVYLSVLLYTAGVLIVLLGLDFTFAVLYRIFVPPDPSKNPGLQALCYLAMFFYLSFVIVNALCVTVDMTRGLWLQQRDDVVFWGISHRYFSKTKPPYVIFFFILIVTVPLPLLWGIIDAAINHQSLLFVAQRCANVAVLVGVFLVVLCYIWFYWRALVYKRSAIRRREERDDYELRAKAYKHKPHKLTKRHWYHATTVLEEFGFDGKTMRYNVIVFTIGCVPIFGLLAAQAVRTYSGNPSVLWGLIGSLAIMCVYFVAWLTLFHRKNQWATYVAASFIVILLVLGAAGGGVSGSGNVVAVVIVLFVAAHGMVTRKRRHDLTRRELQAILNLPPPPPRGAEEGAAAGIETGYGGGSGGATARAVTPAPLQPSMHFDTYLCCCRDVLLDCLCCVDTKRHFGYVHPDIRAARRRYAAERLALRTDQTVLFTWWLVVVAAVACVIGLGNGILYNFSNPVASAGGGAVVGTSPDRAVCTMRYNVDGSASLGMLDLALLSALSYTYGDGGNVDFATWFAQHPTLTRHYPAMLPRTYNAATHSTNISFSDYVDNSNGFHFITLNSNNRGMSLLRNLDDWGESMTFQAATAAAPLMSLWPERYRAAFVQHAAFLKTWFPPSRALDEVRVYIEALLASGGSTSSILLLGDQFNGGYVKLLSAQYNISFVAFNPPGVKYKMPGLLTGEPLRGTQLSSVRSLFSYVDVLEDTSQTIYMPCNQSYSANRCARISTTVLYLLELCGDEYGRRMVDSRIH